MKTILLMIAGAVAGVVYHFVMEWGLQAWFAVIGLFAASAFLFHEHKTRPGVKRGRK